MSHIPPEIDSLLWAVAEGDDPAAFTDFEHRFPQYKRELFKRERMVRALKAAKRQVMLGSTTAAGIPVFRPKIAPKAIPVSSIIAASVSVVTIAGAAYGLYAYTNPPPQKPVPETTEHVYRRPFTLRYDADEVFPRRNRKLRDEESQHPAGEQSAPPKSGTNFDRPVSLSVERGTLTSLLKSVASQANLKLEIAPDFPESEGRAVYDNVSASAVLDDLGRRFGFMAFDEGDGVLLVIPAVDKNTGRGGFSMTDNLGSNH